VDVLEHRGQRTGLVRDGNQVDVIRHQAIAEQGELMEAAVVLEQLQVDQAVGVRFENEPPCVATLGDVVRRVGRDHPG